MSSRFLAAIAIAGLCACAQPVPVIDEAGPPPLPEAEYAAAAGAGASVFRIEPRESLILVRVGRAGRLRTLGHDHAIASVDVRGFVALYDDIGRSHADAVFPLRNLVVDEAHHRERFALDTEPSADDVAGTYANMMKVLEPALFPWAGMRARAVSGTANRPELAVAVTLHGSTYDYLIPAEVEVVDERMTVSGTASIRHSDYGLEPYATAGGLLRVADELGVEFRLVGYRAETL